MLICDTVRNAMTSQQCNTNPYCIVVLHACAIQHMRLCNMRMRLWYVYSRSRNSPLCERQREIRQANPRFAGCIIRIVEVNTRCATSDVNPFKIRCNLQITKATVNETQRQPLVSFSQPPHAHTTKSVTTGIIPNNGVRR